MKSWIKAICLTVCACMAVSFAACAPGEEKPGGGEVESFQYYPVKENKKTDGQAIEKQGIAFPASLWEVPASERYESLDRNGIEAYFIDSVDNTKVFCYVGIPETADADHPVPAIVLVHGATGTAFSDWVEMWVNRGYAAIAMDTEGHMPGANCSTMNPSVADSVKPHGPQNMAFGDSAQPVTAQWVYHALASVIASASFIGSFEGVDETKMGITGVSYGSFLTCLAAAYDDRYDFAAPVYGSLNNAAYRHDFASYLKNGGGYAASLWDDPAVLQGSRTPFLFVGSIGDLFFSPEAISDCVQACQYAQVAFIPNLTHGHYQGAAVEEIFLFADEIFNRNTALLRIGGALNEGMASLELPDGVSASAATIYYTLQSEIAADTLWIGEEAELIGKTVIFDTDESRKHCYLTVRDDRGLYVSSPIVPLA